MTKYNTLLNDMQPRLKAFTEAELAGICERLGDQLEAKRWAEAELHVVCAWCQVVMQEGNPAKVSHGMCKACFDKELAQEAA